MLEQSVESLQSAIGLADDSCLAEGPMILLVEDEVFVREVTCEVLQSAGYKVLTAKNAAEALCICHLCGDEVKLLLTDVILPGETGLELARKLRKENPELKTLFVTGYSERMGLRTTNSEECLPKPFSSEVLLNVVSRLLRSGEPEIERTERCKAVRDNVQLRRVERFV
jgi:CheY-like chemotaxis protein